MGAALILGVGLYRLYREELQTSPQLKRLLAVGLVLAIGCAAIAAAASPGVRHRIVSMAKTREDSSNNFRLNVWKTTAEMIRDHWATGIGPGNKVFRRVYGIYMVPGYEALGAYNVFLELWVELGLLGLLAFVWILVAHFGRILTCRLPRPDAVLVLACGAGMVAIMIFGITDTVFFRPQVNILFWLEAALIATLTAQGARGLRG
jgi:putative inorganic carbon (HCO3(-)) transporter